MICSSSPRQVPRSRRDPFLMPRRGVDAARFPEDRRNRTKMHGVGDWRTSGSISLGGFVTVTSLAWKGRSPSQTSRCRDGGLPLRCRLGSEDPQRRSGDEMALKVEIMVNGGLHAQKVLGRSGSLETLRLALASPHGSARLFILSPCS